MAAQRRLSAALRLGIGIHRCAEADSGRPRRAGPGGFHHRSGNRIPGTPARITDVDRDEDERRPGLAARRWRAVRGAAPRRVLCGQPGAGLAARRRPFRRGDLPFAFPSRRPRRGRARLRFPATAGAGAAGRRLHLPAAPDARRRHRSTGHVHHEQAGRAGRQLRADLPEVPAVPGEPRFRARIRVTHSGPGAVRSRGSESRRRVRSQAGRARPGNGDLVADVR